jgi:hypothetical protein
MSNHVLLQTPLQLTKQAVPTVVLHTRILSTDEERAHEEQIIACTEYNRH